MKNLIVTVVLLFSVAVTAQDKNVTPLYEKDGDVVKATYYHDNGAIAQTGFYKNNKLHGEWKSYDPAGKRIAIAEYNKGEKTGKWFFWNGEKLSEVDYINNKIIKVTRWNNANSIVVN